MSHVMNPEQVLTRYWKRGKLPVDLRHIAEQAGLTVISINPFDEQSAEGVIGSYTPATESHPATIAVDEREPLNRVRFTLAHELGHHFLGHNTESFRDTTRNFNINNFDPRETAANNFAARLLMPAQYVKVLVEDKRITDVRELATIFSVSELAMKIRLQNLRYIH